MADAQETMPPQRARRATGKTPAEPVRLAVANAYLAFAGGGAFPAEPPRRLTEAAGRRLYVHLLRGVVRHQRLLQAEVVRLARRPLRRIDPVPLALAMLGLFQLRFTALPAHAVIYETVQLAPALGAGHVTGWVNAILRTAQREGLRGDETPEAQPLALRTSHPDWMVERWTGRYGAEQTERICEANNRYDGSAVRVETQRIAPEALLRRLAEEGVPAEPHGLLPGALWVENLGLLLDSPAFAEGLCYVQDISSQLLMRWCAPRLNGRVLDVCAAPGGKLTMLLDRSAATGAHPPWPVGAEADPRRMGPIRENLKRLHSPDIPLLCTDGRQLPFGADTWDAVLLDAPCSATGMVRKYPELKWRKFVDDLPDFAEAQLQLLQEAARVLRPGGTLLYATCSLEPEENEQVVARFLIEHREFHRAGLRSVPPPEGLTAPTGDLLTSDEDLLLLPGDRQLGLFGALLVREPAGR